MIPDQWHKRVIGLALFLVVAFPLTAVAQAKVEEPLRFSVLWSRQTGTDVFRAAFPILIGYGNSDTPTTDSIAPIPSIPIVNSSDKWRSSVHLAAISEPDGICSAGCSFQEIDSAVENGSPVSNVATFTNTASGSWGNPETWGGAGVPGPNDTAIIIANTTVTLDTDRSVHNLTINFSGTLQLDGHQFDLVGEGAVFTYNGRIENSSGTFKTFNLVGNGTPGGLTQTLVGSTGGCSPSNPCNFELRLTNGVKVTSPTGAIIGNVNLTIDAGSEFDISGGLKYFGTLSRVFVINNNGTIRNGRLTTDWLVRITGTGTHDYELGVNSGTTEVKGDLKRVVGIQSTATLRMNGALNLHGDLIISGGTLDMFGSPVQFLGNNATLINTGTIANNGAHNTFSFVGNGVVGGVSQTLFSSVSPFPANSTQRLMDNVNLRLGGDASFANLFIQAGSILDSVSRTVRLTGAGVSLNVQGTMLTTGSTIEMSGTAPQSIQTDLNGAAYNNLTINNPGGVDIASTGTSPIVIPGTLTLAAGALSPNGRLTMGNAATISRSQGSLTEAPNFGTTVNIRYFGYQSIQSGFELPAANVLSNLVVDTFANSIVTLNTDVVVNGGFTVASGTMLAGASGRSLALIGTPVSNLGIISHPFVTFNRSSTQNLSGSGTWSGAVLALDGTGSVACLGSVNFANETFINNSTINTGSNFLTFSGAAFMNGGVINGNVQTMNASVLLDAGGGGFNATFRVFSGSTTAKGVINSTLTIQSTSGALQVSSGETLTVNGNTSINGPLSGGGTFRTNGASVTNTALVSVSSFQFGGTAQSLNGTGIFFDSTVTILGGSSTTLTVNKQMSSIVINPGASFNFSNRSLFLSGGGAPLTNAGGTYTGSNSNVEYNGTSFQTLSSTIPTYFNLSLNNAAGTGGFSGLTVNGLLTVKLGTFTSSNTATKDVQINGGATLAGTTGTVISVLGNWVNNGSFLPNLNTVNFSGSLVQTVTGTTATTFDNLMTSTGSSLVLGKDIIVSRILTLGSDLSTGANTLSMSSTGTSTGAADVIGNVRRTGFVAGGSALSFGNPFNSVSFSGNGTVPSEVTFNLAKVAPVGLAGAVQRTYTISQLGGNGFLAKLRIHYLDSELNGNSEVDLKLFRLNVSWLQQGANAIDTTNNWVEKNGVTQFSQWALRSGPAVFQTPFDFDGDGKTDISVFRPPNGQWWYSRSLDGQVSAVQFGQSIDKPVPADFTGDGKTDVAFFRPSDGYWFILRSDDGSYFSFPFGQSNDIPLVGDFDGDGKADPTVFRASTSTWYSLASSGVTLITTFGISGDLPVAADYDGDGKTDVAIFRPVDGSWWYVGSIDNQLRVFSFGVSTDRPVAGDFTGDGRSDIAIFRPSSGEWFIQRSEDGSYFSLPFGTAGDIPVPGDYDGDGKFDPAVFRPSSSTWFINRTSAGILITNFGTTGDFPVPSSFVR